MRLLRNLARRKLRTTLTVAGITIGIWALVVFSSMANKINSLVEGGSRYFGDRSSSPTRPAAGSPRCRSTPAPSTRSAPWTASRPPSRRSPPKLLIGGRDMTRLSDSERTRMRATRMGFVFQAFNLVPTLTAEENVALAADYAAVPGARARTAARDALELVGLADRGRHRPAELSGGEQQRVAIARALVNAPALVFADEPTGNLDSARAAEILSLLRRFNRERGQTLLLVTHDSEVGAACDRIIRMRDGRIVEPERALGAA